MTQIIFSFLDLQYSRLQKQLFHSFTEKADLRITQKNMKTIVNYFQIIKKGR